MTEQEYRLLDRMSYSRLKVFMDDRIKYKRMFEQGTFRKVNDTESTRVGNLTDTLLLEPYEFDNRFMITSKKPTGQMGKYVDALYDLTLENTNEDGYVVTDMDILMEEAYNLVAFDDEGERVAFKNKDFSKVAQEFLKKGETYYNELRSNTGKIMVTMKEVEKAESLVATLKTHKVTEWLMNLKTGGDYEVRNQEIILFDYLGHECKAMVDKLVINHKKKIIQPFDLKTTYFIEGFPLNYLKYRYYVQAAMYDAACRSFEMRDENMRLYDVQPMKFIAADSNCYYDPLIYTLTEKNLNQAYGGFSFNGREYMGTVQALEDIHWHKETDIWTMSKTNYENDGLIPIKLFK